MTPGDFVWISLDCPSKYKGKRVKLLAWHNSGDGILSIDPNTRILIGRDWLEPDAEEAINVRQKEIRDAKRRVGIPVEEEKKIDLQMELMTCHTKLGAIIQAVNNGDMIMSGGRNEYIRTAMDAICAAINCKNGLW